MTSKSSPITPPPFELVNQWHKEACKDPYNGGAFIESKVLKYITTAAAQWGADQELEACHCEVSFWGSKGMADRLQATRRPKPPSLKEQALKALERQSLRSISSLVSNNDCDTIRRALEALPND
jgi:hypothetical protein